MELNGVKNNYVPNIKKAFNNDILILDNNYYSDKIDESYSYRKLL